MRYSVSDTAKCGDITVRQENCVKMCTKEMNKVLEEIVNGEFTKEWILENQANRQYTRR